MRRRLVLAAAAAVALGLGGWLVHAQRAGERMVRVGGAANPCACSTRIEP